MNPDPQEPAEKTLRISEIYLSIQGESTFAGLPCVFIRLTGCDLRCSYCDTAYAFKGGDKMSFQEITKQIQRLSEPFNEKGNSRLPLIEFTGGEPLLQRGVIDLMKDLCDAGYTVLLETSGAHDISLVDPRVRRIVDLKCPGSGETHRNLPSNISHLTAIDEVKCVISSHEDYAWAKSQIKEHALDRKCPVLFSWAAPLSPEQKDSTLKPFPIDHTPISMKELVESIVTDALPVRFQLQMHKFIWSPDQRAV